MGDTNDDILEKDEENEEEMGDPDLDSEDEDLIDPEMLGDSDNFEDGE